MPKPIPIHQNGANDPLPLLVSNSYDLRLKQGL